ncbi:uncharacterized protein Z519_12519 [Cladophialophora bantiana CBS 173.52]|uniref:PWWP domain-containing protein n=1 Tax=Cladophialophora bantiana (strain ATCC 10958 / CBS 173.52 / CDC B-1940 / NIH 8579) TaxID=1442370 RepID=A0A0D2FJM4_CLAB1|nr:uncharacterized protein Z519_12519 [Cladophialophora bantiana CBS 173.52]KIW86897.1 hypothetical protein Z519_12519 [Cladophialophora bantiana CBS 173.52]
MASEESAPVTEAPVKVPQPADGAPPSSAEPASETVAEMSGALPAEQPAETEPAQSTDAVTANGPVEPASEPPKEPQEPQEPSADSEPTAPAAEDTEVKDAGEAETAQPEINGAASAEKKSSSSRRKSSTALENKGKKLNKKKSMSKITHLDAEPGDYYLARLKGYPPWPSIIADEDMLPDVMINNRPVTTKKADGTYNEAYADGGKKMHERTFPIMFLGTNEFVWIHNTDLTPLTPEECNDVPEKGKGKALLGAYKVAAEGHDLQYFKNMLDEHAAALQAEIDAKEAREAEKVAKAEKKKRKSEAKAEPEDVEMEEAEADAEPKKSSKKRKKEADEEEDEDQKPAKTPKTTKIKLTTNKTPKTEEKKPKEKATKARSEKRKSRAAQEDEEMVDAVEPEPEEKPLDPVEARKSREKEVLFLRHKLQKGFLSRDQAPQEDEMPQMATYIKKLEGYADLEVSIIRTTKINKVLKALIKLNTIPRDEEFQFRKRSVELLSQWNKILGAEPADDTAGDKDTATNGVHDEKSEEAPEEEKKEEASAPPEKPALATEAAEKSTAEPEAEKPEENAEPEKAVVEEPAKPEAAAPETTEKAPESAAAATEAADVVKTTE